MKFETARIHFLSNVFAASPSQFFKLPNIIVFIFHAGIVWLCLRSINSSQYEQAAMQWESKPANTEDLFKLMSKLHGDSGYLIIHFYTVQQVCHGQVLRFVHKAVSNHKTKTLANTLYLALQHTLSLVTLCRALRETLIMGFSFRTRTEKARSNNKTKTFAKRFARRRNT